MASALERLFVAPAEKDRGNNINAIRFLAAAAVIYGHMAHFIGVPVPLIGTQAVSTIAVKVFFVLSGYLICTSLLRDGQPFRYLVRRVGRIFPALVCVVLLTAFVLGPLVTTLPLGEYLSDRQTWRYAVYNCVMNLQGSLPGVFEDNLYPYAVNGSLWTLPVEFACYLVLPIVLVALRRLHAERWGTLAVAVGLEALTLLWQSGVVTIDAVVWGTSVADALVLAPYFFLGSFVALTPSTLKRMSVQAALVALFVLAAVNTGPVWFCELLVFALLPYIAFAVSFATPALFGRVFAENDYSYGVYLYAFPVSQTLVHLWGSAALDLNGYALVAFAITLVCAMLSWFLVEKPAGELARRITKWSRSRAPQAAA